MSARRNSVETSRWDVSNNASQAPDRSDSLFKGRYRVPSTRLPGWDYRSNGYYFVTICTRDRRPFLGAVVHDVVRLSEAGRIVDEEWNRTPAVRDYVTLDEYVVMPNHLHGIIVLRRDVVETSRRDVSTNGPRLLADSLGSVVNQFKSVCTKRIRQAGLLDFGWQARFYDHIIREEESLDRIRRYIVDNPLKWEENREEPENVWF